MSSEILRSSHIAAGRITVWYIDVCVQLPEFPHDLLAIFQETRNRCLLGGRTISIEVRHPQRGPSLEIGTWCHFSAPWRRDHSLWPLYIVGSKGGLRQAGWRGFLQLARDIVGCRPRAGLAFEAFFCIFCFPSVTANPNHPSSAIITSDMP